MLYNASLLLFGLCRIQALVVIVRCSPYLCDLIYAVSPVHSIVSQVAVVTSLLTAWDVNHCAFAQGSLIRRAFGLGREEQVGEYSVAQARSTFSVVAGQILSCLSKRVLRKNIQESSILVFVGASLVEGFSLKLTW